MGLRRKRDLGFNRITTGNQATKPMSVLLPSCAHNPQTCASCDYGHTLQYQSWISFQICGSLLKGLCRTPQLWPANKLQLFSFFQVIPSERPPVRAQTRVQRKVALSLDIIFASSRKYTWPFTTPQQMQLFATKIYLRVYRSWVWKSVLHCKFGVLIKEPIPPLKLFQRCWEVLYGASVCKKTFLDVCHHSHC